MNFLKSNSKILIFILLSFLFALTIQQFTLYKGNAAHLIHSIKYFDDNKLQYDWIANQSHHLPLFVNFHYYLIKIFSNKIIHLIHFILLLITPLFIFLICKNLFLKLKDHNYYLIWFALFVFIYHENSFFSGVAGQRVIDAGFQPASFAVLFFIGIYCYLIKMELLSVFFICLSASFHPTYIIHSGFFASGILFFNLIKQDYKNFVKVLLSYTVLILPITLFIIFNFLNIDKQIILEGQAILLDRVKHHADIHYWLTGKDLISVSLFLTALYFVRQHNRFFIFFMIFGFCSIFLSIIQFFLNNNSLALAFPWRTSVFIIPISSMIIVSHLISKINFRLMGINYYILIFTMFFYSFFYLKSHYIKNVNHSFNKDLILVDKIRKNYNLIERLLIPAKLDFIRMNSGIPIFVDWKHHAFKYNEIIKWKKRIDLNNKFYSEDDNYNRKILLDKINNIENISHILINKKNITTNCESLIEDQKFLLLDYNCFN